MSRIPWICWIVKFSLCRTAQMFCAKMHRRNGAFRRSAVFIFSGTQGIPVVAESQELGHCGVSHVSLTFLFVPKRRSSESSGHGFSTAKFTKYGCLLQLSLGSRIPCIFPIFSHFCGFCLDGVGAAIQWHMEFLFIPGPDQQFPVTPRMTLFTLT